MDACPVRREGYEREARRQHRVCVVVRVGVLFVILLFVYTDSGRDGSRGSQTDREGKRSLLTLLTGPRTQT